MDTSNWWKGLAFGAFSSMVADCLTLPIDVTKTRLQISGAGGQKLYTGIFDCVGKTARQEGVAALWKGLEPALWRQCFYGGLRYGLYGPIKEKLAPGVRRHSYNQSCVSFTQKKNTGTKEGSPALLKDFSGRSIGNRLAGYCKSV